MTPDLYSPCPCGSGKKFKFCCQAIYRGIEHAVQQDQAGQHEAALRTMDQLAKDAASPEVKSSIQTTMGLADALGLTGTPSFVVGKDVVVGAVGYDELKTRFGSPGDFAQAYVVAHEVGHHVQDLLGTLPDASARQQRASAKEGNAIQVRIELQADCFAGVWAAHNRDRLDPGDIEEGLKAAHAIGDDTLQQQAQGRVVPDSFTHGTSAQRMAALRRGLESGNPASCNFNA